MSSPTILWGSMGPDSHSVDTALELATGKRQSLAHLALAWAYGRAADGSLNYAPFPSQPSGPYSFLNGPQANGQLILMDWVSWDLQNKADPAFGLDAILAGKHDAFLHAWFKAAAAWGHPLLLRFDSEMNGTWWPNFGAVAGASIADEATHAAKFVAMWRYVVTMARADGATNLGWHWCPNYLVPAGKANQSTAADKLHLYYPGDDVVDWTGFDAYNEFHDKAIYDASGKLIGGWETPWMEFTEIVNGGDWHTGGSGWLGPTYDTVLKIAPTKPMLIGEFNCWDDPRKPAWLVRALAELPVLFPAIRGISLFNWAANKATWPLTGDSLVAFGVGIQSPIYLPSGVWTPPDGQPFGAPPFEASVAPVVPPGLGATWHDAAVSLQGELVLANAAATTGATLLTAANVQHAADVQAIADVTQRLAIQAQDTITVQAAYAALQGRLDTAAAALQALSQQFGTLQQTDAAALQAAVQEYAVLAAQHGALVGDIQGMLAAAAGPVA